MGKGAGNIWRKSETTDQFKLRTSSTSPGLFRIDYENKKQVGGCGEFSDGKTFKEKRPQFKGLREASPPTEGKEGRRAARPHVHLRN